MKARRRNVLHFLGLSACYWLLAMVAVAYASLRTCGMSPDGVKSCDLRTIHVVSELSLAGYLLAVIVVLRRMRSAA